MRGRIYLHFARTFLKRTYTFLDQSFLVCHFPTPLIVQPPIVESANEIGDTMLVGGSFLRRLRCENWTEQRWRRPMPV